MSSKPIIETSKTNLESLSNVCQLAFFQRSLCDIKLIPGIMNYPASHTSLGLICGTLLPYNSQTSAIIAVAQNQFYCVYVVI